MTRWVYGFGGGDNDGRADMKNLLGGKGANLAEMASIGLPVPPGFTITTEVCTAFYDNNERYPDDLAGQVSARPDLLVLAYPLISFVDGYESGAFLGSAENFVGHRDLDEGLRRQFSSELHVESTHPPRLSGNLHSLPQWCPRRRTNSFSFRLCARSCGKECLWPIGRDRCAD